MSETFHWTNVSILPNLYFNDYFKTGISNKIYLTTTFCDILIKKRIKEYDSILKIKKNRSGNPETAGLFTYSAYYFYGLIKGPTIASTCAFVSGSSNASVAAFTEILPLIPGNVEILTPACITLSSPI